MQSVGKREFTQKTSFYLKMVESDGRALVITHRKVPCLKLVPLKNKSILDLKGTVGKIKVLGSINDPILPGYDEW
jgi:antitoxin (DNA-binding transcriptional repressor) of toxin-antitoxin stability system